MLILVHDIIFYFQTTLKKFKKNLSKVLNTFENIMEQGAMVQTSNIFVPKIAVIFLSISLNISFGCSKEQSQ